MTHIVQILQTVDLRLEGGFSFSSFESSDLSAALSLQVHVHLYSASLSQRRYCCDTRAVEWREEKKIRTRKTIRCKDLEQQQS